MNDRLLRNLNGKSRVSDENIKCSLSLGAGGRGVEDGLEAGILPIAKSKQPQKDLNPYRYVDFPYRFDGGQNFDSFEGEREGQGQGVFHSECSTQENHRIEQGEASKSKDLEVHRGKGDFDSRIDGWDLPGHGDAYDETHPSGECGEWRARGCDNREDHPQGIDGRPRGGIYVELYKRRCMRAECPVCYEAWAGREGQRIAHRIKAFKPKRHRKPIHVSASIPLVDWYHDISVLRRSLYKYLKKVGIIGGCAIFHPWREDEKSKRWSFSPHFHVIGYGWVVGTDRLYTDSGWVVKNLRVRESVQGTAMYQLSHAGIHAGIHTVTWFGALAYNKLKVSPWIEEKRLCPICGAVLRSLNWGDVAGLDPPDEEGSYYYGEGEWFDFKIN